MLTEEANEKRVSEQEKCKSGTDILVIGKSFVNEFTCNWVFYIIAFLPNYDFLVMHGQARSRWAVYLIDS